MQTPSRVAALALTFICCFSHIYAAPLNLLPHQKKVIDYLHQRQEINGLVLYHALGAGKTITSLSYAKQQKHKTVILVPEVLKAHWLQEITKVGMPPLSFELLSYNNHKDLTKIKNLDFSTSLVIIDEIQKFIEQVRLSPNKDYIDTYWRLNKVAKILLLTGTPVFNDAADIAYIGNLVVGRDKFPFHPDEFKSEYMHVDTATSLFRGYLTESKLMATALPIYATFFGASLLVVSGTGWILPGMAMAGSAGLNFINEKYPINKVSFRRFNAELFADFTNTYISYYEAKDQETKDYPTTKIHQTKVPYTNAQVKFFLDFVDGVLHKDDLSLLLKDYPHTYSDAMLYINSAKIQQDILASPDAGREIGNFSLHGEGGVEVSNKFIALERLLRTNKGKTAIYSSYYNNGIVLLADFLKKHSYEFEILQPSSGIKEITRVLDNFNQGKNKILLIHPEVTEGISLVGVEQLHILEPVKNVALERQIIGRSVRYKSHSHLPNDRRHVDVYLWESTVNYSDFSWPTAAGLVRRDQWRKRHREVNPNLWTNGIAQLDRQYFNKDVTPDYRVNHNKNNVAGDMYSFQLVSSDYSMENKIATHSSVSSSQPKSQFALPLFYLNYSLFKPFHLANLRNGHRVLNVIDRKGLDFGLEIPHTNALGLGFGMRWNTSKVALADNFGGYKIGATDVDLGFMSRLHYEFDSVRELSFYWKNEFDTNVFFFLPAIGLGLGIRESLGIQYFFTKHLGVNIEFGLEGKLLKDTILTATDSSPVQEENFVKTMKDMSLMKSIHPFISVGLFSSYY